MLERGQYPAAEHNSSYEIIPGARLSASIKYFDKTGQICCFPIDETVDQVKGGGFYGRICLLVDNNNFVIKTAKPDSWHELWRFINWRAEFPPQRHELAAMHDHLSTRIISRIIPLVTEGRIISPTSYGYTHINGVGYAQVLERMHGHPARFDQADDEVLMIQQAQDELLEIGTQFGLEHVGQIHPDNPFAFENLWVGKDGRVIWLDALPAFKHTGFVWPFFRFGFHRDVKKRMEATTPTFNRIHIDHFRRALENYREKIPDEELILLERDLLLYDNLLAAIDSDNSGRRDGSLGKLQLSKRIETLLVQSIRGSPLGEKMAEFMGDNTSFIDVKGNSISRYMLDADYRNDMVMDKILQGVRTAHTKGIIAGDELAAVERSVTTHPKALAYSELQAIYLGLSYIFNALENSSYVGGILFQRPEIAFLGVVIGRIPMVLRPTIALIIERRHHTHFNKWAKALSVVPTVGPLGTVALDMAMEHHNGSNNHEVREEV